MNTSYSPFVMIHGQMPRCGINYLMDILSKHSHTFQYPNNIWEFHHFQKIGDLHQYLSQLKRTRHMGDLDLTRLKGCIGEAWMNYMRSFAEGGDHGKTILLKESNVENLEHFFDYFPTARLILVTRDGRNAVESALNSDFCTPTIAGRIFKYQGWQRLRIPSAFEAICKKWNTSAIKVSDLTKNSFEDNADRLLWIRYEDLYENTISETEKILNFCQLSTPDLNWDEISTMPVRGSSFLRDSNGEINFSEGISTNSPLDSMLRWKDWTRKKHDIFWQYCAPGMKLLGYPAQT